jgi:hypothetical protein
LGNPDWGYDHGTIGGKVSQNELSAVGTLTSEQHYQYAGIAEITLTGTISDDWEKIDGTCRVHRRLVSGMAFQKDLVDGGIHEGKLSIERKQEKEAGRRETTAEPISTKSGRITLSDTWEKSGRFQVRLYNVDDRATCWVNGVKAVDAGYNEDTGRVDITSFLHPGSNIITFKLVNDEGGYTWGFEIYCGSKVLWHDVVGTAGSKGANNDDTRTGSVYEASVNIQFAQKK